MKYTGEGQMPIGTRLLKKGDEIPSEWAEKNPEAAKALRKRNLIDGGPTKEGDDAPDVETLEALKVREAELSERETELKSKEQTIEAAHAKLSERETELIGREEDINSKEIALKESGEALDARQSELDARESVIAQREQAQPVTGDESDANATG